VAASIDELHSNHIRFHSPKEVRNNLHRNPQLSAVKYQPGSNSHRWHRYVWPLKTGDIISTFHHRQIELQ